MDSLLATSLFLGLTLGAAHACDPDHLVAVGTLTAESKNPRQASVLGMIWGIGHTMALVFIGSLILNMKWAVPEHLSIGMEAFVGLMIVFLGVNLFWRSWQTLTIHAHQHTHDGTTHTHVHLHGSDTMSHHHHITGSKIKIFGVGLAHGLAGSAALSLVVMSTSPSTLLGIMYLVIFGLGSIGGMLMMSMLLSLPFIYVSHAWHHQVKCGAGLIAIGFGGYLTWSILS